jgi:hypothetical protein
VEGAENVAKLRPGEDVAEVGGAGGQDDAVGQDAAVAQSQCDVSKLFGLKIWSWS